MMKRRYRPYNRAFTVIEFLIAVAILAIVAGLLMPASLGQKIRPDPVPAPLPRFEDAPIEVPVPPPEQTPEVWVRGAPAKYWICRGMHP